MTESFNLGRKKPERRTPLTGQEFLSENLPGTDTYDDGLNNGKLTMPGSTSTESGGMYMEHKGPNDMVYKAGADADALTELDPEVRISDEPGADLTHEMKGDDADAWLRANDPHYGK